MRARRAGAQQRYGGRGNAATAHDAIATAVGHVDGFDLAGRERRAGGATATEWVDTDAALDLPPDALDRYDAFWIAPGSPYRSMDGALRVIRYAREGDRPLLGTCAGFQHLVLGRKK